MTEFVTGIDDIATMNARCAGWTIVSFNKSSLGDFEAKAKAISKASGLKSFHANEFKRKKSDYYVQFLRLIRETLEGSQGFVCCTLIGQDWKDEFESFCDRLIDSSFQQAGIALPSTIAASKRISAPLFTYQRIANSRCNGGTTLIHIDRDSVLDQLEENELVVSGEKISNQLPIVAALRAYGRERFPNAPEVDRESILIVPDEHSYLVQAADVIGNLSTALVFQRLGKRSKSNDLKCAAFMDAFGDIVGTLAPPIGVMMCGEDLELEAGTASFTFCVG